MRVPRRLRQRLADPRARANHLALALALLLIAYLALFHLPKMGEPSFLRFRKPAPYELYLTSYDTEAPADGRLNFSYSARLPAGVACSFCGMEAPAFGSGETLVSTPARNCPGAVNLTCGPLSVGFSYSALPAARPTRARLDSLEVRPDGRDLVLTLRGEAYTAGRQPLRLSLDGREVASPLHALDGPFTLEERVRAAPGRHSVEASLLGSRARAEASLERPFPWSSLAALALSIVLALSLARDRGGRLVLLLAGALAALAFEFQLAALGAPLLFSLLLAAGLWRLRGARAGFSIDPRLAREAALFALAWAAFIVLVNTALGSVDLWGPYYYRHAEETLARGTPIYFDALSYLGRPATYPPAFFDFSAALAGLAGAPSFEAARLPIHWLLVFAWAFGTYLLFSRLAWPRRALASLSFFAAWTPLMMSTVHTLHVYAYALLALGIALLELAPGRLRWAGVPALAAGFAAHPTVLFFLPVYWWAARGFAFDLAWLKRAFLVGAASAALSLVFYAPIFLASGLPYEIVPGQWGYLLTYGLDGVRFDLQLLLPLMALAALVGLRGARLRWPSLAVLAFLFLDVFVTFRVNLLLVTVGAALLPLALVRGNAGNRLLYLVLAVAALGSLALGLVAHTGTRDYCQWGLANDACLAPVRYLARHASYGDALAVPPLFGHLTTWLSGRRVLADLYVEYADESKFGAVDHFYQTGDVSSLRGKASLAMMDEMRWPSRAASDGRVLGAGARLYDNGFASIHRVD